MNTNVKHLTDFDFENTIKESSKPILVDFWAKWCGPCRMQAPILEELANDLLDSAIIAKVDVDECESLAIKYGVSSIPCLMVFKNGVVVDKRVGLSDKSTLTSMIVKHI